MVTKQISLNVWQKNSITIYAERGEIDARTLQITFLDESRNPLSLEELKVAFYALKPDGTKVFCFCTVNDSADEVSLTLSSQTVSSAGVVECEFQIYKGEEMVLKVDGLRILVLEDLNCEDALESTSEFNALAAALAEAEDALEAANEFKSSVGELSNLQTEQKSSVVGAINELHENILAPHVLYENESGTNNTISLSDSVANYDFLEIYYFCDADILNCAKIFSPNGKKASLNEIAFWSGGFMMFLRCCKVLLRGNSITWDSDSAGDYRIESGGIQRQNNNVLLIRKVVGYKLN